MSYAKTIIKLHSIHAVKFKSKQPRNTPMPTGLLVILNLIAIPFIHELEVLGRAKGKLPSLIEVIRLSKCRKERWFYGYLVLLSIFITLALVPTRSNSTHVASYHLIALTILIQSLIWGFVIYKTIKQK